MNGPNKLESSLLVNLSGLVWFNALAYWAHMYVTKKMKCCEYDTWYQVVGGFEPFISETLVEWSTTLPLPGNIFNASFL
jgi:hypothetical protein